MKSKKDTDINRTRMLQGHKIGHEGTHSGETKTPLLLPISNFHSMFLTQCQKFSNTATKQLQNIYVALGTHTHIHTKAISIVTIQCT